VTVDTSSSKRRKFEKEKSRLASYDTVNHEIRTPKTCFVVSLRENGKHCGEHRKYRIPSLNGIRTDSDIYIEKKTHKNHTKAEVISTSTRLAVTSQMITTTYEDVVNERLCISHVYNEL
jgi:hypothetical protein